MLMTICGVTRFESIKKLNLLSNDFYNRDLINYFIKNFGLDVASIDDEFHVLDMLYNESKKLDSLNIEINSLDIMSFDKIIGIICKNQFLNSLKVSFFSSDISYLTITLFKEYEQIKTNEEIGEYILNEKNNMTIEAFEEKMLRDLSLYFIDDLYLLFEIIKNKNNLESLGFNFDLPSILINNMNYKIPIFKFILNIIFLIDNNEFRNKNKIKKLTLLSPYTIFDNRTENNIEEIFKDIRIYKNCNQLKELNIQFQFYNMNYIINLINPNFIILSIGDLDFITFKKLVNYLTSYNFSNKSNLKKLNIKLLNKITAFNTDIKIILRNLFNIKIKNLLELTLFTNIIIDNKVKYIQLINILKYNWIPSYLITLNEESNEIITSFNFIKKNILFLITYSMEKNIFKEIEIKNKRKDGIYQKNDEIFWILKYIFNCRYNILNYFEIKYLIFTILKYLYLTSDIKLSHKIEKEK